MRRVSGGLFPPIALERCKEQPIYRQLYDWFQRAIASGQLKPGQRVPSTRALAGELNVSRIPVLNAFEQLHAEGYLQTFVGAGTCVASSIPQETIAPPSAKLTGKAAGKLAQPVRQTAKRKISDANRSAKIVGPQPWLNLKGAFRMHLPALDQFPVEVWSRLVARHARKLSKQTMAYGEPMGYAPFREAIAEYIGAVRAVRCEASQIMVVAGSQQGLQRSARVLVNPGDAVWLEEPGYFGARRAFAAVGAQLIPVPVDDEGLIVEEGIRRCPKAQAVYITPSHQYPLGTTMSASRRMQLLNWASRSGAWIIEDDYDSEYRFGVRPIGSLQGLDSDARVIYVGTFSKVMFPALRMGYLVVPVDLAPAFSAARDADDIFSPTLYQAILTDFITEGHFGRHVRRMRMLYMERCNALVKEIHHELGGTLEIVSAEAGMHVTGLLPAGVDDAAVWQHAMENGISAMPLSFCYLKRSVRNGLVLGYGTTDGAQIREGVRKLKVSLEAVMGGKTSGARH
jgi:GntR family transcriptional regulator / MocR family aminotransferase